MYVFYNKLRHLCRKYNILLKDLTTLTHDSDIHECGPMSNDTVLRQMSADLFHKLESPGCLPRDNKRMESLLYSYGQSYDGFNMLRQIILPHFPALQSGTRPVQPTWDACEDNLYVLQVLLQTYYSAEKSMGQAYPPAQQSIDYLNEVMKSTQYAASAKICKQKVVDNGLENTPPRRLTLSELATHLDLETPSDKPPQYGGAGAFVQRVNTRSMSPPETSNAPRAGNRENVRGFRCQPYKPPSRIPNDPSLKLTPSRKQEQCKACRRWGHTSNSCFLLCQVYWCQQFIKSYPRFCEAIAFQYEAYHSKSQRAAQVRCMFQVNAIAEAYDEDSVYENLERSDLDFTTELEEPTAPEV